MSKAPFMPLWVSDFLGDTLDLDATEIGAYMLLLMAQWNRDGASLSPDQEKLRRICRCGRNWPKVWGVIGRYFQADDCGIFSKRLRQEAQNVAAKREVNAHNGALGGAAKALKTKDQPVADAKISLQRNSSIPEPYTEREDTEAKASDAGVDFAKQLWDRGIVFLGKHGTTDKQARAIIGKWRKAYQDTDIFEAFSACSKEGAIDPIPWITARLNGKDKGNGKSDKQQRKLNAFIAGSTGAPPVDRGPDLYPALPLLARG